MSDTERIRSFLRTLASAESATANEAWDEASRLWAEVVESNPVEGRFWARLGEAHLERGDDRAAITALEHAFDLRDWFPSETAYKISRCHARAGDLDEAMSWLEKASDLGYRDIAGAREDDDLAALRTTERFRELTGIQATDGMSRDDGWRLDVRFLMREMTRRAYAPFQHQSEADFNAAAEALIEAIPDLTDAGIIVEITRLLMPLGDGHARVRAPRDREDLQRAAPVQMYVFEEGLFIVAADSRHEDLLGAKVIRIGERTVEEVMEAVGAIIPRDSENTQWIREGLPDRLRELPLLHALGLIPDPDKVTLTIEDRHGTRRTVSIAADAAEPAWALRNAFPFPAGWSSLPATNGQALPLYLRNAHIPYWFTYLRDSRTVYFQFNSVQDAPGETLKDFTDRLFGFIDAQEVAKLVVDMRWNDGGNTFLSLPLLHRIVGSHKINRRGALFVIIGRRTFSAAQNGVSFLNLHTEAIFAGEPTGSSPTFTGESADFDLPYSKVRINVSDLRWVGTWPGDYRRWIAPTLYTPPTFAAYRDCRDEAIEAILAYDEHLPGG